VLLLLPMPVSGKRVQTFTNAQGDMWLVLGVHTCHVTFCKQIKAHAMLLYVYGQIKYFFQLGKVHPHDTVHRRHSYALIIGRCGPLSGHWRTPPPIKSPDTSRRGTLFFFSSFLSADQSEVKLLDANRRPFCLSTRLLLCDATLRREKEGRGGSPEGSLWC